GRARKPPRWNNSTATSPRSPEVDMQPDTVLVDVPGCDAPLPITRVAAGTGGRPVVLAPHRDGVDAFVLDAARRLAGAGCPTYVPDVYHGRWSELPPRERKARLDDDLLLGDLRAVA